MPEESRRQFLKNSAVLAATARLARGQSGPAATENASGPRRQGQWEPRVAENIGSLDDATLTWLAQMGHKWAVLQGTDLLSSIRGLG